MKNEHQAHLHVVASSPTRKTRQRAGSAQATKASHSVAVSASMTTDSVPKSRIPAYRPPAEIGKEDGRTEEIIGVSQAATEVEDVGMEVDEPLVSQCNKQESHVERVSITSMAPVDVMSTPLFLTKKKKVMHCELDEPGQDIPFPKNPLKRGLLQRMFGCFHKPSIYSPPRVTSHRKRPPSSGMVPAMLALEKEVAPLGSSLAVEHTTEETVQVADQVPLLLEGMHHEALMVNEGLALPVCQDVEVDREAAYSNRFLRQQQAVELCRIPAPPSAQARSRTQSPTKHAEVQTIRPSCAGPSHAKPLPSGGNPAHSTRTSSQYSPIRMTKAQRLREEANLKKIQERNVAECAHLSAMPKAVRRSFLPQLRESLKTSNFDDAKRDSIATAAAQVLAKQEDAHSTVPSVVSGTSERNPLDQVSLMSLSFSDDPFYRELAKIDHSLTPEDLDKLRDVLASSNLELWK